MCGERMVKIEFDLPKNIYQALKLLSDAFGAPFEELLISGAQAEVESSINCGLKDYTEDYTEPLIKKIEALLYAPDDTLSGLHQIEP